MKINIATYYALIENRRNAFREAGLGKVLDQIDQEFRHKSPFEPSINKNSAIVTEKSVLKYKDAYRPQSQLKYSKVLHKRS